MSEGFLEPLLEAPDVWQRLREETRPLILYGMGDGADKIQRRLAARGKRISGVFASDEFVRGQQYAGMPVCTLGQIEARFDRFVVVLAFASQRPEVMAHIRQVASRHELVAPSVPVYGDGEWDRLYLRQHRQQVEQVYRLLADEMSRRVYADLIAYQMNGDISFLDRCASDQDTALRQILRLHGREHFVDLGAYTGDTIAQLLRVTDGEVASVTAWEPDRRNYRKLCEFAAKMGLEGRMRAIPAAAWHRDEWLAFSAKAGRQSSLGGEKTQLVEGRSVDSVLAGQPVTYLKLDVEGAERQALEGAKQSVLRWRPKLNVALYHRCEDLFALPLLVHRLCPQYQLFVRHHPYYPGWDTNLYARAYLSP